ncbi:hypothetical protein LIA77_04096 [Sarocladium implicatum]|nr:hypothetical protein LIA77_04096 [Sarocladium implicatum]
MSSNKQQTNNAPATNHHKDDPAATTTTATAAHPLNTLPAPGSSSSSSDPSTPVLDISGGDSTVSLDAMGPVVVNKDGTVSRVTNWGKMTEIEKETTLRVLGKRNKQRLAALKEAEAASSKQ